MALGDFLTNQCTFLQQARKHEAAKNLPRENAQKRSTY